MDEGFLSAGEEHTMEWFCIGHFRETWKPVLIQSPQEKAQGFSALTCSANHSNP
jgi:hypothetical protein